ncbi:MAG TPA: hypothetical protein DCZ59_04740 [Bacteroidetes bacterium]|nr:hypothetical protein [Bacteroidota bacterium]
MALIHRLLFVCTCAIVAGFAPSMLAQGDVGEPPSPDSLPTQFVPAVQRVFQVYGSISSLYNDKVKVVNPNGDTVLVDSVRRRSQVVTYAPSSFRPGDSVFLYGTLGLTAIDMSQTLTDADAPLSGRDPSGDVVSAYRYLGFWFRIDVIASTPDDDNPVRTGPTVVVWPNPFRDVVRLRVARGTFEDIDAEVYSIDGRRITSLVEESSDEQSVDFRWDGLDDAGAEVANGTYVVRLLARLPGSSSRVGFSAKIMRSR